jgi:hypothetical protein
MNVRVFSHLQDSETLEAALAQAQGGFTATEVIVRANRLGSGDEEELRVSVGRAEVQSVEAVALRGLVPVFGADALGEGFELLGDSLVARITRRERGSDGVRRKLFRCDRRANGSETQEAEEKDGFHIPQSLRDVYFAVPGLLRFTLFA